jgi:catechol 2,3-dioxygenase-like lactoylglutathione lyase family enzyme
MGLRYFGIRVRDLERSVRFYTELLGLREVGGGRMYHGGRYVVVQDPRTRQRLELNWYPPGHPWATRYVPGEGLDHIGFRVPDAAATYRTLLGKGVRPALAPGDRHGVRGVYYLLDPDGNWLEFF